MNARSWLWKTTLALCLVASATAASRRVATVGQPVVLGGSTADLAIDEGRGVLYAAGFGSNSIAVVSLADLRVQSSFAVDARPGSISLSTDAHYLAIAHLPLADDTATVAAGTGAATGTVAVTPAQTQPGPVTILDLTTGARKSVLLDSAPLAVAFGSDGKIFVVTGIDLRILDPVSGVAKTLNTFDAIGKGIIPPLPKKVTQATIGSSGDGQHVFGFADVFKIHYDVAAQSLTVTPMPVDALPHPKMTVVNQDGSSWISASYMSGRNMQFTNQFANPLAADDTGTAAFDPVHGLIYAQMPAKTDNPQDGPILLVADGENLAVKERIRLAENFTGKSVVSSDGSTMYGVSESGIQVVPVGALGSWPRITASVQDVVFRGNICDKIFPAQKIMITDKSGGAVRFAIATSQAGIRVFPTTGTTPATIQVSADLSVLEKKGTTVAALQIVADGAVNLPRDVRVLVNSRTADQRGAFFDVPGDLSDVMADPNQDRFFILRRDTNELLVFDGSTYSQLAALKTGNTPNQMAITGDGRWLLVANYNSQTINVFDLETLQEVKPVQMPFGNTPHSMAVTSGSIVTVGRDMRNLGKISTLNFATRTGSVVMATLTREREITTNAAVAGSPSSYSAGIAQSDGTVLFYDGGSGTAGTTRKAATALAGAMAAGSGYFVFGNTLFNGAMTRIDDFDASASPAGFVFVNGVGLRIGAEGAGPGVLEKVDPSVPQISIRPTRTIEAPALPRPQFAFSRSLAPLANGRTIVALTTSGFTILPWDYDAPVAPPSINQVVNAADFTKPIAPGGLISVFGVNMSPVGSYAGNASAAVTDSCLQINGATVPVLYVSSKQMNAQLPILDGNTTLRLNTPGGMSDSFNISIQPTAPSVFRIASDATPAVVRGSQLVSASNPIHVGDVLTIYATGLGRTNPEVPTGNAAPMDRLTYVNTQPEVTIGGTPVDMLFAGLAPGQIGVYQINIRVNENVPLAVSEALEIRQGAGSTSVPVRVVQ